MFRTSAKSKTILTFRTMAIAALMLLFAAGAVIGNQKAVVANLAGSGLADRDPGISYPSPLSHWFGGEVLHHGFHHLHSDSGFHHRH
ncbi:MAG TPA: hypothetical protein VEL11_09235 [Candidatus Bathyarchaeia archaeon]|nr:hypothetical protein [Candidatus Bathyarchaeia archaeon]